MRSTAVIALFDHEEVGSESTTGAAGPLLEHVLERLALATGGTRADFLAQLAASSCISADNAHSVHPNYPERHEPDHRPIVNQGPAIKLNSNQRYATSARSAAMVQRVFEDAGVPWQVFVSRNNMPCGIDHRPDHRHPARHRHRRRRRAAAVACTRRASCAASRIRSGWRVGLAALLRAARDYSGTACLGDVEQALQLGVQVDGQLAAPPRAAPSGSSHRWMPECGLPTTTCSLRGRMNLAPFGIARSEPPMPTGTIGTPAFTAM